MPDEDQDRELILAIAQGRPEALDALVDRHQARILRYLRALTASEQAAEDALQETFVAAWRGAGGYRGDAPGRAWLLGLARRQAARTWRRRAGEPDHPTLLDEQSDVELGLAAGWGQAEGVDPQAALESWQERRRLHAALERLSAEDREILVLRDLEQLSGAEVAALLELSLPAQKSRLHRARLRLMAALREAEPAAAKADDEVPHG
ncbi:RNA polymerase sigma factor [Myxococcota bacterium]|nr:RNA polymerase sigma factor [Myxococcota bacterium]